VVHPLKKKEEGRKGGASTHFFRPLREKGGSDSFVREGATVLAIDGTLDFPFLKDRGRKRRFDHFWKGKKGTLRMFPFAWPWEKSRHLLERRVLDLHLGGRKGEETFISVKEKISFYVKINSFSGGEKGSLSL